MYAFYCLHEFHILPSQYLEMPIEEQAFIQAAIDLKIERKEDK